ncbi:MAG: hypothetical protein KGL13_06025 [Gammaproteobacteria bacterium]|nr:hypothetical protein [Gammaproteobacteria bacterium]MDE2346006.1 hypothetical protein [Gammaproteobacteria bacterium]
MGKAFVRSVKGFRPWPEAVALLLMGCSRWALAADPGAAAYLHQQMSGPNLIGGILFGSLGVGYFIYGKKQGKIAYLLCGAVLTLYTFVVSSALLVVVIGLLFSAGPWLIGRFF